jgi:hypothetical protein
VEERTNRERESERKEDMLIMCCLCLCRCSGTRKSQGGNVFIAKCTSIDNERRYLLVRVARWFVFNPKMTNLGKFWRAFEW